MPAPGITRVPRWGRLSSPACPPLPAPACLPQDMAAFVDAAHGLGMGVAMDVVLHHGAPSGNMLWDFDGW